MLRGTWAHCTAVADQYGRVDGKKLLLRKAEDAENASALCATVQLSLDGLVTAKLVPALAVFLLWRMAPALGTAALALSVYVRIACL